jgi:hypothetical protein
VTPATCGGKIDPPSSQKGLVIDKPPGISPVIDMY